MVASLLAFQIALAFLSPGIHTLLGLCHRVGLGDQENTVELTVTSEARSLHAYSLAL